MNRPMLTVSDPMKCCLESLTGRLMQMLRELLLEY